MNGLQVVQLALNTSDIAGTLRLYSEAFGFRNAGGNALWGETIRIQGLSPDSRSLIWWMIGAQPLFQLELFHHMVPTQRPQPDDWRPSDLGWTRFGIGVESLDRVRSVLNDWHITITGERAQDNDSARLVFRDPFAGVMVEVVERPGIDGPALLHVTYSVNDIAAARQFFGSDLGFALHPVETLHHAADEALWGLDGAQCEGFVAMAGDVGIEVVQYASPIGRPASSGKQISDQGIMNVGLGSTDVGVVRKAIAAFIEDGCVPTLLFDQGDNAGTYFTRPGREFELLNVNEEFAEMIGFRPSFPFLATLSE